MSATAPRSLADQFRGWPDERLAALLAERPELATPPPHDSSQLASRAATRPSLLRALDLLTVAELHVLDALVLLGETPADHLAGVVHAAPASIAAAVDRLVDLALVWPAAGGLRPLTGVADALRGSGSGLQPFAAGRLDATSAQALLEEVSPQARALLEHVDAAGGEGRTDAARRGVTPAEAATPVEELLSRDLLLPREPGTVYLPGEVGVALRGGRTTREPVDVPPELATGTRSQALVDRAGAGAAFEAVRRVELLLDRWGTQPPAVLRAGGVGVRELRAVAAELAVDETTAALLVEVAAAAALLAAGTLPDATTAWLPTDAYDAWSELPAAQRWARLATAWLTTERMPGLVGGRDSGDKPVNALTPELASPLAAETRRLALVELAAAPAGAVLATGTGTASLVARLAWRRPRRPPLRADLVAWTLREAAVLGLVGLGGLTSFGRALLGSGPQDRGDDPADAAAAALTPLLPEPVDHVLVQADLTAVAPGPLESGLARRLQLLADVESRGGATVYRFAPASVRRAFDAGWSALEIHDFLGEVSRTPVPQPLTYLVDDTARTFGTVRVGTAEAFLRADDEGALTELLHDPRAAGLGLRRIAPTVLVTDTPVDQLLARLRELGTAPVVEAPDGTLLVARRDAARTRTPRPRRPPGLVAVHEAKQLSVAVRAVRAGDALAKRRPVTAEVASPSGALAVLRTAVEIGQSVWVGYVDNHGATTERIVDPVSVEGGRLTAYDHRSDETRTFAVHRITAVRVVE